MIYNDEINQIKPPILSPEDVNMQVLKYYVVFGILDDGQSPDKCIMSSTLQNKL
jgi:hypothetical protein